MKKLIIHILLTVIFVLGSAEMTLAVENTSPANENNQTNAAPAAETEETSRNGYTQPIIPKPTYLPGPGETDQEASKTIFGTKILPRLAVMMTGFVGGLSLVFLVIAGVRFVTAYGEEEAITNAKKQAMFAVIGFLLALLSYAIVTILTNIEFVDDTTEGSKTQQNG